MFRPMIPISRRSAVLMLAGTAVGHASTEPSLAIRGYDPVAYFALERATPGNPRFIHDWDEHRWQFANARHLELFKADPTRYAPQFANFCAVALARGEVQVANPEYWLISDGKLYLFGKPAGPDRFRQDPGLLQQAERNRARIRTPQRAE
jgi:hypothetical protein